MSARSRLRLASVAAFVLGIWTLASSIAEATATAYPSAYRLAYYFAAAGVALICTGGVLAIACAEK